MPNDAIKVLIETVNQTFTTKGWHGPTLRGALRGVTPETALWVPASGRNHIWGLMLHAAYWKYIVRRHITGDKTLKFPRSPSNFPAPPEPATASAWRADLRLLNTEHEKLIKAIAGFPASQLHEKAPKSTWTYAEHIHGVAAHDAYHTGQIQLIKRLFKLTVDS